MKTIATRLNVMKDSRFWSNAGFTVVRGVLLVLILSLSSSLVVPLLVALVLGLNTGMRKQGHTTVLIGIQAAALWVFFFLFAFQNPEAPEIQLTGILGMTLVTVAAGLCGQKLSRRMRSSGI